MAVTRDVYDLARDATIARAFRGMSTCYVRFLPWWRCLWRHRCATCGKPAFNRLADEQRRRFCVECWGEMADGREGLTG
jgi:hypothetical protein